MKDAKFDETWSGPLLLAQREAENRFRIVYGEKKPCVYRSFLRIGETRLSPEGEAIRALREQQSNTDTECAHGNADDILCDLLRELGHHAVVEEYEKVDKWYA
jgi:hypothetical protein